MLALIVLLTIFWKLIHKKVSVTNWVKVPPLISWPNWNTMELIQHVRHLQMKMNERVSSVFLLAGTISGLRALSCFSFQSIFSATKNNKFEVKASNFRWVWGKNAIQKMRQKRLFVYSCENCEVTHLLLRSRKQPLMINDYCDVDWRLPLKALNWETNIFYNS